METIKMKINGIEVEVPAGSTILQAAEIAGVRIPTLCYMKDINAIGACRMCVVEVKGARSNPAACLQVVSEGMEVQTNTPALRDSRKKTMELLLSNHRLDCLGCVRSGNCEFQQLSQEYGCDPAKYAPPEPLKPDIDDSAIHLVRDNSKCILCRRCGHRRKRARFPYAYRQRIRSAAESDVLCQLRPVYRSLPDRRTHGKRRYRKGLEGPRGSDEACHRRRGSVRSCTARRVLRSPDRNECRRQDDCCAPPPWL